MNHYPNHGSHNLNDLQQMKKKAEQQQLLQKQGYTKKKNCNCGKKKQQ